MRDSQIGSFGALALVLVVALKIALVAAVLARGHHLWLIAIPAVGRLPRRRSARAALRARAGHRRRAGRRRPARRAPRRRARDGDRRRARLRAPARPARRRRSRARGPGDRPPRPAAHRRRHGRRARRGDRARASAPRCSRCSPGGRRSARLAGRLGVAGSGQVAHAARATWRACGQTPARDAQVAPAARATLARRRPPRMRQLRPRDTARASPLPSSRARRYASTGQVTPAARATLGLEPAASGGLRDRLYAGRSAR